MFFFFFIFFFSQFKKNRLKKDSCFNFLNKKKNLIFEKKRFFFDFWNKLDLNIFYKKNFEIMIFFHFYFFLFSQFKKKRLKKDSCFYFSN